MANNKNYDLDTSPIGRLIIQMTTPVMIAGLLTTTYGFVDMIFASRLGGVQVASIAFVSPLFMMLRSTVRGIAKGGVSVIAKLIGQKDFEQSAAYATQLRIIIISFAVFFSIAGVIFSYPLLKALQISGPLFDQSLIYTRIMFFSLPASAIVGLYMTLFMSQGKMNITSQISFLGLGCNIVLNSISVFVLNLGIDGLAYATIITQYIQAIVIVFLYHRETHEFNISWQSNPVFPVNAVRWHLLKVGTPLSFSLASTSVGILVINVIIAPMGYEVVAAFAIGNRINSLMFMPMKQMGSGIVPLIAHNWGAGALARARTTIKLSLSYALILGVLAGIFIQIVKWPLGSFLTNGESIIFDHVINYVGLVGWTVIAWTLFHMLQSIFEGFQKTSFTFWTNLFRLWGIRIPGVILLSYFFPSIEEYAVWYTMFWSNIVTLLFALVFFAIKIPEFLNPDADKGWSLV